jgi:glycine/D-amino acid oxidase-like deaminating enzyme
MKQRVIVVGGGVIGTMHAWRCIKRGYEVVHLERDAQPQMASVRNFGLVWVGGRKSGVELEVALQARQLWSELALDSENLDFRANGSLTIARSAAELRVVEESMRLADSATRGWELLSQDAVVEPATVLSSIRAYLERSDSYTWVPNADVVGVVETGLGVSAETADGRAFPGDWAIVCPGADHKSIFAGAFSQAPLRRVRLQMFSTEPFDVEVTTSVADGDSLRYYPAYDVPSLKALPDQHPIADASKMQLLLVQRKDGSLTIGDTHEYEEPFDFALSEPEYDYLIEVAEDILGSRLPRVSRRWAGIYSQRTDGAVCDRQYASDRIVLVTGLGGRGNSLSPAIAENTLDQWGM